MTAPSLGRQAACFSRAYSSSSEGHKRDVSKFVQVKVVDEVKGNELHGWSHE